MHFKQKYNKPMIKQSKKENKFYCDQQFYIKFEKDLWINKI